MHLQAVVSRQFRQGITQAEQHQGPATIGQHEAQIMILGHHAQHASQVLTNQRFGIIAGFAPVQFWAMVIGINVVLYAVGSWWLCERLLKRQLA